MMPIVGLIAGRVILAASTGRGVMLLEMTRDEAMEFTAQMTVALCHIDAGSTVKPTFSEFMEGFKA